MTIFTLEINLTTNTSVFTLSLLASLLPPHKSLLDMVGMQNIYQKPFVLVCFQQARPVLSVLLIHFPLISIFTFLKIGVISGHYALSQPSAPRQIL